MSTGKILTAFVLIAFIVVSIVFVTTGFGLFHLSDLDIYSTPVIIMSIGGGAAFVFLLNLIGLGFRSKYFGGMGLIISALILSYGIYVLVTNKSFIPVQSKYIKVTGGIATGVGGAGLLTSIGIITM